MDWRDGSFMHRCWAVVDLDAFEENYRALRSRLREDTKLLAVVKADAYGHGDQQVARLMEEVGADWLGVACYDEALSLRAAGSRLPILILGHTPVELCGGLAEQEITQAIFSPQYARDLRREAARRGVRVKGHLKIDSGMHRIGFNPLSREEMELARELYQWPELEMTGIFSHFCCADESDEESRAFTRMQFDRFSGACRWLQEQGVDCGIRHCSGTAATITHPEWQMDMVRGGIGLYGMLPSDDSAGIIPLHPAMSLYTVVSMVKEVAPGEDIGYGRKFRTTAPTLVATVPIGYADGYPRCFCNRAKMLIRGQFAPVLGKICMDQVMLDVTHIPGVQAGDLVTVAGRDGEQQITFDELAALSDTINYDRTCSLAPRIPRVYLRHGQVAAVRDYLTCRVR